METRSGSDLSKIVGMGTRRDSETEKMTPISDHYPSYFKRVCEIFEAYPVHKFFGIKVTDAMALPVDQWYQLRDMIVKMPPNSKIDIEVKLTQLLRDVLVAQGGGE